MTSSVSQSPTPLLDRIAAWTPPKKTAALAAASGLMYPLAVPPWGLVFTGFLQVALLVVALADQPWRRVFTAAWLSGTICQLCIYWWLIDTVVIFGNLPWAVAAIVYLLYGIGHGLFMALSALSAHLLMRRGLSSVEGWPLGYVAVHLFIPQLFPFYLGVEFYTLDSWRPAPPDVRVMAAIVCLAGAVTGELLRLRGRLTAEFPVPRIAGWAVAFALLILLSWPRTDDPDARTLRVAIAQTDFDLKYALKTGDTQRRFDKIVEMYQSAVDDGAELVVFSESTLPFPFLIEGQNAPVDRMWGARMTRTLSGIIQKTGVPMIASGVGVEGQRLTNRAFLIEPGPDGRVKVQHYDKRRLLWFGEYVPLRNWWPKADVLFQGVAQFDKGPGPVIWDWNGRRIIPSICYEAILPVFTRSIIPPGGGIDLFINLTNDKWFGLTPEKEQHLMLATWRSAETGIPMIRATLDGTSAVIDGRGRIIFRSKPGEAGVYLVDVPVRAR